MMRMAPAEPAAAVVGSGRDLRSARFVRFAVLSRCKKDVSFDGVLFGEEVVIAAAESVERCMRTALDNTAVFDDEIWSARRMVERRCAITNVVRPRMR